VAVHAADPAKNPVVSDKATKQQQQQQQPVPASPSAASSNGSSTTRNAVPAKWSVDTWKSKKAVQLPEYPNKEDLESVLGIIDSFPPIVFAGEARSLEERLAEASMGNAFLLQGGDCAESFKEFNANNIRDTFRILLQMGVVLMFGGQMPVIKVTVSFSSFWG
jgi:3-deoxy-7-phosphoheptulonate synthase